MSVLQSLLLSVDYLLKFTSHLRTRRVDPLHLDLKLVWLAYNLPNKDNLVISLHPVTLSMDRLRHCKREVAVELSQPFIRTDTVFMFHFFDDREAPIPGNVEDELNPERIVMAIGKSNRALTSLTAFFFPNPYS